MDKEYIVTLGYTDYGNSLTRNKGYASVTNGVETIKGTKYTKADTGITTETKTVKGLALDSSEGTPKEGDTFFKKVLTKPSSGVSYYVMDETGKGLVPGGQGNVDNEDNLSLTLSNKLTKKLEFSVKGYSKIILSILLYVITGFIVYSNSVIVVDSEAVI